MENDAITSKKIIINCGVILGILSVLLGVVIYLTNSYTDPNWIYSLLGFIVITGVIIYGIKTFKTSNRGFLTLSNALKVGVGIALIGGIISSIWNFTLATIIEPDYTQQVLDAQRDKMLENPDMTEEIVDQSMAIVEKMSSPYITIAMSIISSLFFGFIISLIVGLIMQKKEILH